MKKIAICAGSYDPVTFGHLDVIERASSIFDELYVSVGINQDKKGMFTPEIRMDFLKRMTSHLSNVHVTTFDGLLVRYAKEIGAKYMIRGIRAVSDFEFEFTLNGINQKQDPDIQTIFMMPPEKFLFISSSNVKALARFDGNISEYVPEFIAKAVKDQFKKT